MPPSGYSIFLHPNCRHLVSTGISLEIPFGFEGQIRNNTICAELYGLFVLYYPGTIDLDYRGQINVKLIDLGDQAVELRGLESKVTKSQKSIFQETTKTSSYPAHLNKLFICISIEYVLKKLYS